MNTTNLKILLLSVFFLLCFTSSFPQSQRILRLTDEYNSYLLDGKYCEAIRPAEKLKTFIRAEYGERNAYYNAFLVSLSNFYLKCGQIEKAEEYTDKAMLLAYSLSGTDEYEDEITKGIYGTIDSLATAYAERGDADKTMSLYRTAISLCRDLLSDRYYAAASSKLLFFLMGLGRYEESLSLSENTIQYFDSTGDNKSVGYAAALSYRAFIYSRMGRFEKAIDLLLKSNKLIKEAQGNKSREYGASLNNIAVHYYRMGEKYYQQADSFLNASAVIAEINKDEYPQEYLHFLVARIDRYGREKKFKTADSLLNLADQVIARYNLSRSDGFYADYMQKKAFLEHRKGNNAKAVDYYKQCIAIQKALPYGMDLKYAWGLMGIGMLYMDMQLYPQAEKVFEEKNAFQVNKLKSDFQTLSEEGKITYLYGNYFSSMSASASNLLYRYAKCSPSFLRQSFNLEIFSKSLVLDQTRDILTAIRKQKDPSVLRIYQDWHLKKSQAYKAKMQAGSPQKETIRQLEDQADELETELTRRSPAFKIAYQSLNVQLEDIQAKLEVGEVAIEFIRFELYSNCTWSDSVMYAAYVIKKDQPVPVFVPLFEESSLTAIFQEAAGKPASADDAFYRGFVVTRSNSNSSGRELYNLIWKPLLPHLKGANTISFSPTGRLYNVSFAALQPDSLHYLADSYVLNQYSSIRQIALRASDKFNPGSIGLFGFATFSMDSIELAATQNRGKMARSSGLNYPLAPQRSLAYTEPEVADIGQLFKANGKTATVFVKKEASEANFKRYSGNAPAILHLATHGFFIPADDQKLKSLESDDSYSLTSDPLMRTGLLLAGANYILFGNPPIEGVEDGILTAYEISQLDLENTSLIVLSACETGLGDIKGAEGVFGLQRAFKMAGVKQMIISLWEVPDKATAELMTAFYTRWLKGATIREAFAGAQSDLRKTKGPNGWAGFVLVD